MALIEEVVEASGVDLQLLMFQNANDPDYYREQLAFIEQLNGRGRATAQFGGRCTGALMSFLGTHPFMNTPTFEEVARAPLETRLQALAQPEVRGRILAEEPPPGSVGAFFAGALDRFYDLGEEMDYEPEPERSLRNIAAREGRSVREVAYDLVLAHSVLPRIYVAFTNYAAENLDPVRDALAAPSVVLGASDAGAHVLTVCDGSINTFMLTHWVRDRKRGERASIEEIVHLMTQKSALSVGLTDRGLLAPGKKADINVFELDALRLHRPQFVADLPGGARRIMQKVTGYEATVVAGQVTRERDEATGALPGRLVRPTR
jgi:N-acyl-D-aspartate/D-glutamate deacylase